MAKNIEAPSKEVILNTTLEEVMSTNFAIYAKHIIQDRALPDVRDGLKPVQRRIIYTMNEMGTFYNLSPVKSARVTGEVMGKYHPHGDSSIYEAIVRMSQSWKNNYPLTDIQGNNGSIDGDGAAAMRYTESRLSLYGQTLITDIKKDAVDMIDTYDGSRKEPTVLPTFLPNLLINGSNGIAAGYATNIPPFNLIEVVNALITRIDSPNCKLETLMSDIPAPDFPTGGILLDVENMKNIYETGRGKITIRSKVELKNSKTAYITEIPFEVNKAMLIREIHELALENKNLDIVSVLDESDENGISIAINLKNPKNWDNVREFLFKNTQLQIAFNFNMVAIANRKPILMSLTQMLDYFIEHMNNTIARITNYDLSKALIRREILQGLIKAVSIIDEIIEVIKKSANKAAAKEGLMNKWKFSELQAESIVSLRLYHLTNADVNEFNKELEEVNKNIENWQLLLSNPKVRNDFLKAKLREYRKTFNSKRRSTISENTSNIDVRTEHIIDDKPLIVTVSKKGYIKAVPYRSFNSVKITDVKTGVGDLLVSVVKSNAKDRVILVTNKGNYVTIPVYKIAEGSWKDVGTHINNLLALDENEYFINAFNYKNDENNSKIVLASHNNKIKCIELKEVAISKVIKFSTIFPLEEGDYLVSAFENTDENLNIISVSENGKAAIYPFNQIPFVGKGASGARNLSLEEGDHIAESLLDKDGKYLILLGTEGIKKIDKNLIRVSKRGGKTNEIMANTKENRFKITNSILSYNSDLIYCLTTENTNLFIEAKEIPLSDINSKLKLYKGLSITDANILVKSENPQDDQEQKNEDSLF